MSNDKSLVGDLIGFGVGVCDALCALRPRGCRRLKK